MRESKIMRGQKQSARIVCQVGSKNERMNDYFINRSITGDGRTDYVEVYIKLYIWIL